MHISSEKKDIPVIGEGPTQGLDDTTITEEAKYSIKFTRSRRKFCLGLLQWRQQFDNGVKIQSKKL